MIFEEELINKAQSVIDSALKKQLKITTAESCTGGLISALITEIPGASEVLERGFVTYSNTAKQQMLGVSLATLNKYGAVSIQTAEQMSRGAVNNSQADIGIAVTGIAGPGGGSKGKPVGLVYISGYNKLDDNLIVKEFNFKGNRQQIRLKTAENAFTLLLELIAGTDYFVLG